MQSWMYRCKVCNNTDKCVKLSDSKEASIGQGYHHDCSAPAFPANPSPEPGLVMESLARYRNISCSRDNFSAFPVFSSEEPLERRGENCAGDAGPPRTASNPSQKSTTAYTIFYRNLTGQCIRDRRISVFILRCSTGQCSRQIFPEGRPCRFQQFIDLSLLMGECFKELM